MKPSWSKTSLFDIASSHSQIIEAYPVFSQHFFILLLSSFVNFGLFLTDKIEEFNFIALESFDLVFWNYQQIWNNSWRNKIFNCEWNQNKALFCLSKSFFFFFLFLFLSAVQQTYSVWKFPRIPVASCLFAPAVCRKENVDHVLPLELLQSKMRKTHSFAWPSRLFFSQRRKRVCAENLFQNLFPFFPTKICLTKVPKGWSGRRTFSHSSWRFFLCSFNSSSETNFLKAGKSLIPDKRNKKTRFDQNKKKKPGSSRSGNSLLGWHSKSLVRRDQFTAQHNVQHLHRNKGAFQPWGHAWFCKVWLGRGLSVHNNDDDNSATQCTQAASLCALFFVQELEASKTVGFSLSCELYPRMCDSFLNRSQVRKHQADFFSFFFSNKT